MQPKQTRRTGNHGERGASLIEVMVVLVIILIGLFLAIRVFPIGFGVLRANGNRTVATQLAENAMGLVKGDAASMPDGVLYAFQEPGANNTQTLRLFTDVSPDNLDYCRVLMSGSNIINPCSEDRSLDKSNSYFADINKFRYIKGEAVKVPLPTPTAYGSGSLYTVKFGPLYMDTRAGTPTVAPNAGTLAYFNGYLKVYGSPLSGRQVVVTSSDTSGYQNLIRDDQTYLIDYGVEGSGSSGAQIMLPPRAATVPARTVPNRTFNITISYDDGNQVVTTEADPITVTDGVIAFFPIRVNGTQVANIIPGTEVVSRNFTRIASTATFDPVDPYQYKLMSSNVVTGERLAQANFGVLAFNPAGASFATGGTSSAQPFTAYLDYAVLDWHIIRDDREVPAVLPVTANVEGGGTVTLIPVRTTLRNIKRVGDPETDNTFYSGIYGNTPGPNTDANPKDFQVFALDALANPQSPANILTLGAPLPSSSAYAVNGNLTVATANAAYYMLRDIKARPTASIRKDSSYETGVIYVNTRYLKAGTKIRMLYKAVGDWGVAVQKAYARYNQVQGPLPRGAYSNFVLAKSFSGNRLTAAQLRFPYSDFNKSVVVTLQYTKENGEVVRLSPIMVTLNRQVTDKTIDQTRFDQRYAVANVADYIPFLYKSDFATASDCQVVGSVQGASLKTRVVWHDNDTPNERWHVQDMDSNLNTSQVQ